MPASTIPRPAEPLGADDRSRLADVRPCDICLCTSRRILAELFVREGRLPSLMVAPQRSDVVVEIGGLPIRLSSGDPAFIRLIQDRYAGYVSSSNNASFDFDIALAPPGTESGDEDLSVTWDSGRWLMERGDFRAEWNPSASRGRIEQTINPYSLDSVLRIVHTLLLAQKGGFLVHPSSAIPNGPALFFPAVPPPRNTPS